MALTPIATRPAATRGAAVDVRFGLTSLYGRGMRGTHTGNTLVTLTPAMDRPAVLVVRTWYATMLRNLVGLRYRATRAANSAAALAAGICLYVVRSTFKNAQIL